MGRTAVLLLGVGACQPSSSPNTPIPESTNTELADLHFVAGDCPEAVTAYSEALPEARTDDDLARIQLFRAMARLRCDPMHSTPQAFAELHNVERDHPETLWGRLARAFVDELVREQGLQQTLERTRVELAQLRVDKQSLLKQLTETLEQNEDHKLQLANVRAERRKLQAALEDAKQTASEQQTLIDQLQQELVGLKRVDMGRDP